MEVLGVIKMTSEEVQYSIWNNKVLDTSKLPDEEINKQPSVYEVIRVLSGVPLFLEEHLERLRKSIDLLNFQYDLSLLEIREQIYNLIKINDYPKQNIKIIVNNLDDPAKNTFMFFIPSQYPSSEDYNKGIKTISFKAERHNPNAKVVANHLREEINKSIEANGAYEAILINKNGEITEGSRSNVFLVKDDKLYTAPATDVLVGITRSRIINIATNLKIPVIEAVIPISFLQDIEGIFLTGTSPKVLPIATVDNRSFCSSSNPVIIKIMEVYDSMISEYISSFKW